MSPIINDDYFYLEFRKAYYKWRSFVGHTLATFIARSKVKRLKKRYYGRKQGK